MPRERIDWYRDRFDAIVANVGRVIQGKDEAVRLAVLCLCVEGHLLLEDVPGTGKTSLAKALACSIDASYARIQFTPDLLPSDVTGVSVWNQGGGAFEFKPGPVFANVVLADEINRASPKTQSALLEVMEERSVTTDGVTRRVRRPFLVIATQNPVDMEGTYRLPEAQLDRFLMRATLGYPDTAAELEILDLNRRGSPLSQLSPVVTGDEVLQMAEVAGEVHVEDSVKGYIVRLVERTRQAAELRLGASPRASLALLRVAAARAAAEGREFVTPEDVKAVAPPVLVHRLLLTPEAQLAGTRVEQLVVRTLAETPIPRMDRA